MACAPHSFYPQGDPRLGSDGERASGGLKARAAGRFACKPADSRPTPLSDVRTPTSESVGWLLLLFATEKQVKIFPELYAESSVFTNFFLLVLLGPKVPKSSARRFPRDCASHGLHGARKIKPMRHPVADAPQPAPSFSASNESAELLCRHGRHRVKYQFIPTASFHLLFLEPVFPQGDSRPGPMAKERPEG